MEFYRQYDESSMTSSALSEWVESQMGSAGWMARVLIMIEKHSMKLKGARSDKEAPTVIV